jgi:hypothetical protein
MDPKLIRMYSDILSEAPAQQPPQTQPSAGGIWNAIKGTFQNAGRSNVNPPAANSVAANNQSSDYSGRQRTSTQSGRAALPARPAKPAADSIAARGKVDAMKGSQATAAQTQTSSYGGQDTRTANARAATDAPPAQGFAGGTTPDADSIAARGSVDAMAGSQATADSTQSSNYGGQDTRTANARAATDAPPAQGFAGGATTAKPAPVQAAAPKGVFSTPTMGANNQGTGQAALPAKQYGGGYDPSKVDYAATGGVVKTPEPTTVKVGGTSNVVTDPEDAAKRAANPAYGYGGGPRVLPEEELEEEAAELEEELNEMMRLSGLALNEKAVSKQQQKFMGMVHAMQKGEKVKGASSELKKAAKSMGKKDAKDFAATKHKGLPQKVTEGLNMMLDEEGHTLSHIVNRFKHEVRRFIEGDFMPENLYDALYDYYLDRGDMPYGTAKGREGDPYQWVSERFYDDVMRDLGNGMNETVQPVMDDSLNELALLAGLHESRVDECGDMGMDQRDTINVSTNMSSDGNKSVNISAQGEKAEELLSMLKLAGMSSNDSNTRPAMMVISNNEEMMDEERETEYSNTPEEEYQSVASITRQGNDLNREKKQFANMPKAGDNPMATDYMLDEELSALLDSVLVKEAEPRRPKGDTGQAEIFTADLGIQPPSPDEGPVGKSPIAPKAPATPKAPVVTPGIKR